MEISFNDSFFLLALTAIFYRRGIFCYFNRGYYNTYFCEMILNLDQWFRRGDIFYTALAAFFAEQNQLCNFCRGPNKEHFCEIIHSLQKKFRKRCRLKIFYRELWWPFCLIKPNYLCLFVKRIMRNISVKLFRTWIRRRCSLKIFYLQLWQPFCLA